MSEVCRVTAIDLVTMRVIERMKARDLVSAVADNADRRKVIVSLTSSGQKLLRETIPAAQRISELTVANLNPAEQLALQYLLRKLADGPGAPPEALDEAPSAAAAVPRQPVGGPAHAQRSRRCVSGVARGSRSPHRRHWARP